MHWLPRSLRSVAGAPRTARKKKPATPVGMTESEKREEKRREEKKREPVNLGRKSPPLQTKGGAPSSSEVSGATDAREGGELAGKAVEGISR
jgi:hypothetical protein